MKKILVSVLAVMLLAVPVYAQEDSAMPQEFGGVVVQGASVNFVVEAINAETREVTLKDESGESSVVKCGPEVRNFDQIAVGDNVKVDLIQTVTVVVSDKAVEPSRVEDIEIERAPLGETPAGTITHKMNVMAAVTDIDYVKRTVTLKGPLQTLVVEVDKEAYNFAKVKVGDMVGLKIVQKMAIAVTK